MLKSVIAATAVIAGTMLAPTLGLACEGGKVIYEDKFQKLNPAWGFSLDPKTEKIDATGYVADFPPNAYRRGVSQLSYYNDYVACATFTMNFTCTDPAKCETQGYVGIVVLAGDTKNFYTFDLSPPYGTYSVSRLQNDKWLAPVGWTALPDKPQFKSGDKVELQATVKGSNVKFKVNGKDVLDFEAIAPQGGTLVGFELASTSFDTKNSQFNLSNFMVKELPQ